MNFTTKTLTFLAGCALASTCVSLAPAQAAHLYNGWNYTIDSFDDGSEAGKRGADSAFEFYGMALKETDDKVYIALNSNLGLGGQYTASAQDNYVHYGDLFFNFTGEDLEAAQGNLFAVKFDEGNDSGVTEVGLYGNVFGDNVTADNSGFKKMASHKNWANKAGTASMGDLSHDEYFQQGDRAASTSIKSGDFLGEIFLMDNTQLAAAGLDFGAVDAGAAGRQTFGFSFDRDKLPNGDYIAHLFAECINDGIALKGTMEDPASVPEPSLLAGFMLIGALGLAKRRRTAT